MPVIKEQKEIKIKDKLYSVDYQMIVYTDNNYGADADGNRGLPMTFVEDIYVKSILDENDTKVEDDAVYVEIVKYLENEGFENG